MEKDNATIPQLAHASVLLEEAAEAGLIAEVVVWALMAMKEDPTITVEDAINVGYNEWIK